MSYCIARMHPGLLLHINRQSELLAVHLGLSKKTACKEALQA